VFFASTPAISVCVEGTLFAYVTHFETLNNVLWC